MSLRRQIIGNTLLIVLPTFSSGLLFLFIIFFYRIPSIEDHDAIYTNVAVGFVLVIGSVASTSAPLLFRIPILKRVAHE